MKTLLRWITGLWALIGSAVPGVGQAVDPTFQPAEIFRSALVSSIVPYADGRVLVLGDFSYANAQAASQLVRYQADGSVDYQFSARLPSFGTVTLPQYRSLRLMPDGRILIVRPGQFQLNGAPFTDLAMLLPSGRIDSSFVTAGMAGALLNCVVVQPDGKILLGGEFTRYGGTSYNYLVRLLPNGRIDTSFRPGSGDIPTTLALQSDGKIVVGSPVSGTLGNPTTGGLWRLLPDGQPDASFPRQWMWTEQLLVQPDDKILVGGAPYNSTGPVGLVYRLLPNGAADPTFTPPVLPQLSVSSSYGYGAGQLQLHPNGHITVVARYQGMYNCRVVRLQPNGAVTSLAVQVPEDTHIYCAAALADGRLWLGGGFTVCSGQPGSVAAFAPGGRQLPAPRLLKPGEVNAVALQPNGQILLGGSFSEVNGTPAGNVARLYANGTVDTAFTRRCATDGPVLSVTELPGGKIALGGMFRVVGAAMLARPLVALLTASGQPDPGFVVSGMRMERQVKVVRPYQGNLIIGGDFDLAPNYYSCKVMVLSGTGNPVLTAPVLTDGYVSHLLESRSAGMLALGYFGSGSYQAITSLTRNPAFTPLSVATGPINHGIELPGVRLLVGGNVLLAGAGQRSAVLRLQANGVVDPSFSAALYTGAQVLAVAQQPNGRVLAGIGGSPTGPFLQGLLANGQADAAFNSAGSGPDGEVRCLQLQPDGAVLVGGAFQHYNGAPYFALLRLAATSTATQSARLRRFDVYPNPAHETLRLHLDAAAQPRQAQLLDALGRPVRTLLRPNAEATLDVRQLPAGVYLLRVEYAAGPVTRRVVVE